MRTALLIALGATFVSTSAFAAKAKPTVAILYFDYQGKNEEMLLLKKGLAQMLISDLSGSDAYQIVERDRLQEIIEELKLGQSRKIDKSTAAKIGKLLGARYMVLGGYFDVMGTLRVDARVVEVETGKILKSVGSHGKPDTFMDLEKKLSDDLSGILSTSLAVAETKNRGVAKKKKRKGKRKRPKKLAMKTALLYSKALDAKDRGDKKAAKETLKKVVKDQPDFSLAQLDLDSLVQ